MTEASRESTKRKRTACVQLKGLANDLGVSVDHAGQDWKKDRSRFKIRWVAFNDFVSANIKSAESYRLPLRLCRCQQTKMLLMFYFSTTIGGVLKASQPILCRKLNRIFLMMSSRRSKMHVLRQTSEREQTKSGRQRK